MIKYVEKVVFRVLLKRTAIYKYARSEVYPINQSTATPNASEHPSILSHSFLTHHHSLTIPLEVMTAGFAGTFLAHDDIVCLASQLDVIVGELAHLALVDAVELGLFGGAEG